MPHLNTEELLKHVDGELKGESSAHIDRCGACQESMAELESWLYEVERDLRASVPAEAPELRAASWERLQEALYLAKPVIAFPVRWSPAYAVAAGLAIAVLGGYLAFRAPPPSAPLQLAEETAVESVVPAPESAVAEPGEVAMVQAQAPVAASRPALAPSTRVIQPTERAAPRARFEIAALTRVSRPPENQVLSLQAPALRVSASLMFVVPGTVDPGTLDLPLVLEPRNTLAASAPAEAAPMTVDEAPLVLAGHRILNRAGVWQEDIRPVHRAGVVSFEGTVENAEARQRVTREIQRAAGGQQINFVLLERQKEDAANTEPLLASANQTTRASGGVVRSSLLSHFSDAARRSFQAPEPAALESELDRYVSDVFRGQSRLLSHVYALNGVLTSFDASLVRQLESRDIDSFRQVVEFHARAIREHEARIYDRLSEALPRRFWTYRAEEKGVQGESGWRRESQLLLNDALELDATLHALLVTPETSIDTSDVNLSCGELLARIRTRLARLQAPIQALQ